jgi:hypothetical protein
MQKIFSFFKIMNTQKRAKRIVAISAGASVAFLTLGLLLFDEPLTSVLFMVLFLSINSIPFKLLKKYKTLTFTPTFKNALTLNTVLLIPPSIASIIEQNGNLANILMGVTLALVLVTILSVLLHVQQWGKTPRFDEVTVDQNAEPIYATLDILMQQKALEFPKNRELKCIPSSNAVSQPIIVKLVVWLLIAMIVFIPFERLLTFHDYWFLF